MRQIMQKKTGEKRTVKGDLFLQLSLENSYNSQKKYRGGKGDTHWEEQGSGTLRHVVETGEGTGGRRSGSVLKWRKVIPSCPLLLWEKKGGGLSLGTVQQEGYEIPLEFLGEEIEKRRLSCSKATRISSDLETFSVAARRISDGQKQRVRGKERAIGTAGYLNSRF